MQAPHNELLLALRSPNSGWLATVVCALEEALQDPNFSTQHRDLLQRLLDNGTVPAPVAAAAQERLNQFELTVGEMLSSLPGLVAEPSESMQRSVRATRPKLTLVGNAA